MARHRAPTLAKPHRRAKRGAAPAPVAPPDDPLRQLFMGRRRSKRIRCAIAARLEGTRGSLTATIHSLSLHGALIELGDLAFHEASCEGGLLGYGVLLEEHATGGLVLLSPETCVRRDVQVVRLTVGSSPGDPVRVGVNFEPVLEASELEALCELTDVEPEPEPERRGNGR